jgi:hypothetical protein
MVDGNGQLKGPKQSACEWIKSSTFQKTMNNEQLALNNFEVEKALNFEPPP